MKVGSERMEEECEKHGAGEKGKIAERIKVGGKEKRGRMKNDI